MSEVGADEWVARSEERRERHGGWRGGLNIAVGWAGLLDLKRAYLGR